MNTVMGFIHECQLGVFFGYQCPYVGLVIFGQISLCLAMEAP